MTGLANAGCGSARFEKSIRSIDFSTWLRRPRPLQPDYQAIVLKDDGTKSADDAMTWAGGVRLFTSGQNIGLDGRDTYHHFLLNFDSAFDSASLTHSPRDSGEFEKDESPATTSSQRILQIAILLRHSTFPNALVTFPHPEAFATRHWSIAVPHLNLTVPRRDYRIQQQDKMLGMIVLGPEDLLRPTSWFCEIERESCALRCRGIGGRLSRESISSCKMIQMIQMKPRERFDLHSSIRSISAR